MKIGTMKMWNDTIAALATAEGSAAVAVVRISGPQAFEVADRVYRGPRPQLSGRSGGTFVLGRVVDDKGVELDDALFLIFKSPRSYTGEDQVEIQFHGGRISREEVLQAVLSAGCRMAEPGEFTRRAFINGKMDLIQAEAVADFIRSDSERASRLALEQMHGRLSRSVGSIYDHIVAISADLEATLDFSEDELPSVVYAGLGCRIESEIVALDELISTWNEGRIIREGIKVVILGRPNAGKSTLFNTLLRTERSIVSRQPGTTRDVIEETCHVGPYAIRLFDTAGLRETDCEIEKEGVRRAITVTDEDAVVIYVIDGSCHLDEADRNFLGKRDFKKTIVVINKSDASVLTKESIPSNFNVYFISAINETGIDEFKRGLLGVIGSNIAGYGNGTIAISARHKDGLLRCREQLSMAHANLSRNSEADSVPAAERLGEAARILGETIGRQYHEDMLDKIFSSFCIGK